ncbi:hypothetical protein [Caulobacter sp. S45]|jgi:hypothetical protein|uniref:hypothetical protein n=1 Tax=Caulobacter sp. S45 TaxID=1641861 RepID=UPI00131C83C1|nr:hypothetical protein [Caulobacter sp. S45]
MSTTPPTQDPSRANRAGEGIASSVTDARGAVRTGRNIWILVISLALAVVVVMGYWLLYAPHFNALNNARAAGARNVSGYPVQNASPRSSPAPGEPSNTGNAQ